MKLAPEITILWLPVTTQNWNFPRKTLPTSHMRKQRHKSGDPRVLNPSLESKWPNSSYCSFQLEIWLGDLCCPTACTQKWRPSRRYLDTVVKLRPYTHAIINSVVSLAHMRLRTCLVHNLREGVCEPEMLAQTAEQPDHYVLILRKQYHFWKHRIVRHQQFFFLEIASPFVCFICFINSHFNHLHLCRLAPWIVCNK